MADQFATFSQNKVKNIMHLSYPLRLMILGVTLPSLSLIAWSQTKPKPKAVPEIASYIYWPQVTQDLVEMSPAVAMMCASPSPQLLIPTAKGTRGPHAKKFIRVYVNPIGETQMMARKSPRFPVGTVIVKQKLHLLKTKGAKGAKPQQIASTPELLNVMIKREAGYNSKSGDWEYMVTDGTGQKVSARGQLQSCQNCHQPFAKTDYVVRSYLPKEVRDALKDVNSK